MYIFYLYNTYIFPTFLDWIVGGDESPTFVFTLHVVVLVTVWCCLIPGSQGKISLNSLDNGQIIVGKFLCRYYSSLKVHRKYGPNQAVTLKNWRKKVIIKRQNCVLSGKLREWNHIWLRIEIHKSYVWIYYVENIYSIASRSVAVENPKKKNTTAQYLNVSKIKRM